MMAETAPLSSVSGVEIRSKEMDADCMQAHTHARKAAQELEKVHFTEAAREHQQASTNFARAARSTSDTEVSFSSRSP